DRQRLRRAVVAGENTLWPGGPVRRHLFPQWHDSTVEQVRHRWQALLVPRQREPESGSITMAGWCPGERAADVAPADRYGAGQGAPQQHAEHLVVPGRAA